MYYVKVNSSVVLALNLRDVRTMLPDGNFLLIAPDLAPLNLSGDLYEQAMAAGGTILTPVQAKMEQLGRACFPLPTATDERFVEQAEPRAVETFELASPATDTPVPEETDPSAQSQQKHQLPE